MMIGYRMFSPLGDIVLCAQDDYLSGLFFTGQKHFPSLLSTDTLIDLNASIDAAAAADFGELRAPKTRLPMTVADAAPPEAARMNRAAIPTVIRRAYEQMNEFFGGERKVFTVPHRATGTSFQQQVWAELARIPYAESVSYGTIARRLNLPSGASRAVGSANGRNPLSIIVPCHRVIASSGALTGYAGGIDRKQALLRMEARHAAGDAEFCLRSA